MISWEHEPNSQAPPLGPRRRTSLIAVITLTAAASMATAQAPKSASPLSPGDPATYTTLDERCPTFSWARLSNATSQRLVVFSVDDATGELADEPRLSVELPATAGSWTPQGNRCLESGRRFAWTLGSVDTAGKTSWSDPLLVQTASVPSEQQVERAMKVIERYLAAQGETAAAGVAKTITRMADATRPSTSQQRARARSSRQRLGSAGGSGPTAAIRGAIPATSGEVYGVFGQAASADGAGVLAENTAGPDLVLGGTEPTKVSETGIERSSAGLSTFDITNTGGGSMELRVGGVAVTTAATDQDTLGALTCPNGQVPKSNGSSWACGQDVDTNTIYAAGFGLDLNGTTFVADLNEIQERVADSCPPGQSIRLIHPNGDVECETDDEASFSFGPGIVLDGNTISVDPGYFSNRLSNVDTYAIDPDVAVGAQPSMARLPNGNMVIAYATGFFDGDEDLNVASCLNALCTSATVEPLVETLDLIGDTFAIGVGSDGLPIVAYSDTGGTYDLIVAHCDNVACSSATHTTIDSTMDSTDEKAIVIGSDGLALIAYFDTTNDNLKVAHCQNVACTSAILSTIDQVGDVGKRLSMAMGPDDRGVISYLDRGPTGNGPYNLIVAHCNDILCNTASTNTIEDVGTSSSFETAITIGSDGLPVIAYNWPGLAYVRIAHCSNATCSTSTRNTIATDARNSLSLVAGSDGMPRVFFRKHTSPTALRMVRCHSVECFASSETVLDDGMFNIYGSEAVVGPDGLPMFAVGTARSNGVNASYSVEVGRVGLAD